MRYTEQEIGAYVEAAKNFVAVYETSQLTYNLAQRVIRAAEINDTLTLEVAIDFDKEAHYIETSTRDIVNKRSFGGTQ